MSNKFKPHEHRWIGCTTKRSDTPYRDAADPTKRYCLACHKVQYYHSNLLSRTPSGWYDRVVYN